MKSNTLVAGLVAGLALNLLGGAAQAACISNPPAQSSATFPAALTGKLVYHSYVKYGDGTSQLFLYDFSAHTLTQLSKSAWGITDPMNGVFSPDGKWLAFMGIKNNAWNVFMVQLGTSNAPINMTNSTGATRNEDPKFSADGKTLVFKQNGDVKQATLSYTSAGPAFTSVVSLTNAPAGAEYSMPFLAPDASAVYYASGTGANMGLMKRTLATGATAVFDNPAGLQTYYPIVRADGTVFYARWKDTSQLDQIYSKTADPASTPNQLALNDCISNNSDPAPVSGTNYLFFSSTTAGGYQLYVGDVTTGQRWSLSQFGVNADTTKAKLGSSYYGGPAANQITLLSQGHPAAASASYNASLTPDKAFDGNTTSTRWDSPEGAGVDPQWISVDLGATKTISSIDLYWDAGALVYQIQTSNDNVNWTTIYSTNNGVSYGHVTLPNLNGHGRYVRMYGTKRATQWGYSLDEMQVWGS
ncbi:MULTISPECIES: discoidin domain-containing protein [Burkholderia]|uniref:Coagulation factor 5/8 type domain-containing protein n=1 Tax=Burkholderia aenigmatica TaxID=2015348 RepID=A0ABY6XK37_9BURK|nr:MULTISPECIES: discoidin domain-containing protein [Burkholderia]VWC51636.1 coagulation factor 5/8 type domain-containing protein [Burkholderia aenigmatica]VWD04156.1 coagulation factor 5/8 type domain-containing protein [Burkholderia aenigmatica]